MSGSFITNTIQDHKNKYLPNSKLICHIVYQSYYVYGNINLVFNFVIVISQVDFLLIKSFAEIISNYCACEEFLKNKECNVDKYNDYFESNYLEIV